MGALRASRASSRTRSEPLLRRELRRSEVRFVMLRVIAMRPVPKRKSCPIQRTAEESVTPPCERCKLIDLGNWLSEGYRIPGDDAQAPDDDPGRDA
jgi:endogenous inhibitor of DNA gyrase (YacG/DUF329 family)